MSYLEVAVSAVPAIHRARYTEVAANAAAVFMTHGARAVTENWGVDVPKGKVTDFHRAVQCQDNEVVVVSTILWPSKDVRDKAWANLMDDPAMANHDGLLDMSRMIFGGFEEIVAQR
ncbi:MAG: DUF1428 domain-containing protein [Pseudomonadota bacterium]